MSDFNKCNLCNHSTKIPCDRLKATTEKIFNSQYPQKTDDPLFTIHYSLSTIHYPPDITAEPEQREYSQINCAGDI
jgi:hypothetical protein